MSHVWMESLHLGSRPVCAPVRVCVREERETESVCVCVCWCVCVYMFVCVCVCVCVCSVLQCTCCTVLQSVAVFCSYCSRCSLLQYFPDICVEYTHASIQVLNAYTYAYRNLRVLLAPACYADSILSICSFKWRTTKVSPKNHWILFHPLFNSLDVNCKSLCMNFPGSALPNGQTPR